MRIKRILLHFALCAIFCFGGITAALAQDHLKDLDSIRSSMTEIGYKLPDVIKAAKPQDIRTLERVFEINNYALMTIESYLKMLKVFSVAGGYINKEIVGILNGWLNFMSNYCKYDLDYLNDAKKETQDKAALEIIDKEMDGISRLMQASIKGSSENSKILAE